MNFMVDTQELVYILRVIIAGICGILVGLERKNRSKEAGIRTHFVVASGAALIMIVSKYAFFDVAEIAESMGYGGDIRIDPSRVASTIASGIGFLGAGMIFVHKNTITGLTTAAGIWAMSGVGMAIGAGMYAVGIGATLVILFAQFLLHLDFQKSRNSKAKILTIKNVSEDGFQTYLEEELAKRNVNVLNSAVELTDEGTRNYLITLELSDNIKDDEIITIAKYKSSIKPCM